MVSWFYSGNMTTPNTHTVSTRPTTRKALVVGAGIAGLSAATALQRAGWHVDLVERSPDRRRGGYFIMLFGCGRIGAERLGIKGMHARNAVNGKTYSADRRGPASETVGFDKLPADPWMMLRGDVERAAFGSLPAEVDVRFGTSPTAIVQGPNHTSVTLRTTTGSDGAEVVESTEDYDLVVGADGVRSTVRKLVWGPHEDYVKNLGDMICAYEMPEALPGLREQDGAAITEPGRSFTVFNFEDHAPTVLFSYKAEDTDAERARAHEIGAAERLREIYGPEPLGEMMDAALAHLEQTGEYLFGAVEQVHVDHWHHGRVILLGDAAWCPSLYSGMGATSGIAGADVLREMLLRHPDSLEEALTAWEAKLRKPVTSFQDAALPMRRLFTVDSQTELDKSDRMNKIYKFLFTFPPTRMVFRNLPSFRLRNSDLAA